MKKQLFIILGMLFAGQADAIITSVADAGKKLAQLHSIITNTSLKYTQPSLFNDWESTINECMNYSINNSTNIRNTEDKSLTTAANQIKDLNKFAINLYLQIYSNKDKIKKNYSMRQEYEKTIQRYKSWLDQISTNVNKSHLTPSKRKARDVIIETARVLKIILDNMRSKLNQITIILD